MDNNLKLAIENAATPLISNNTNIPSALQSTDTSVSCNSFLSKLYDKKLYILLLLVAMGVVVFYYKKKNLLKSKLKDFTVLHQEFKPSSELSKDLEVKETELATLKQQNEHLLNENNRLQQQMQSQQMQAQQMQSQQMQAQQMQAQQMQTQQMQSQPKTQHQYNNYLNNNDRLENEEDEINNLGEDENVQQYNLTNNEMNDVVQALEQ